MQDLGSTNGTFVNDQRGASCTLKDGDQIKVGRSILKYMPGDNIEANYHEEIYRLMTMDALTQTYNRRYFNEALERECQRAPCATRASLSLLIFDIDYFKKINDTYGHVAGDSVLRQLAVVVKPRLRLQDVLARVGGEEFAVLLPEVDIDGRARRRREGAPPGRGRALQRRRARVLLHRERRRAPNGARRWRRQSRSTTRPTSSSTKRSKPDETASPRRRGVLRRSRRAGCVFRSARSSRPEGRSGPCSRENAPIAWSRRKPPRLRLWFARWWVDPGGTVRSSWPLAVFGASFQSRHKAGDAGGLGLRSLRLGDSSRGGIGLAAVGWA